MPKNGAAVWSARCLKCSFIDGPSCTWNPIHVFMPFMLQWLRAWNKQVANNMQLKKIGTNVGHKMSQTWHIYYLRIYIHISIQTLRASKWGKFLCNSSLTWGRGHGLNMLVFQGTTQKDGTPLCVHKKINKAQAKNEIHTAFGSVIWLRFQVQIVLRILQFASKQETTNCSVSCFEANCSRRRTIWTWKHQVIFSWFCEGRLPVACPAPSSCDAFVAVIKCVGLRSGSFFGVTGKFWLMVAPLFGEYM